jgi:hypothetical protein
MDAKDKIFRHLPEKKKFVKNLHKEFSEEQCQHILRFFKDPQYQLNDDLVDDFDYWFREYCQDESKEILSMSWDGDDTSGPMCNGGAWYSILHGLVICGSTDDGTEVKRFNRKHFYPWYPGGLATDVISMSSDYFSIDLLIDFVLGMIDFEEEYTSIVYINDDRYSIDYEDQTIYPTSVDSV